jgi:predicted glycogen debranching enzyme
VLQKLSPAIEIIRDVPVAPPWDPNTAREWLVTNGLGGYASGTLAGPPTRRYHTWLVAALPAPLGRVALVSSVNECVHCGEHGEEWLYKLGDEHPRLAADFHLLAGLPVWRFDLRSCTIERRLFMPHQQNTLVAIYTILRAAKPVRLRLRPQLQARFHEATVDAPLPASPDVVAHTHHVEITLDPAIAPLRLALSGREGMLHPDPVTTLNVSHALEAERGYPSLGGGWSPGYYEVELAEGEHVTFLASTEPVEDIQALSADEAWNAELDRRTRLLVAAGDFATSGLAAELVLAADQFIMRPAARTADEAKLRAAGEHARSVIAGYHWFTDWGRDTMISLEGLMLSTGRPTEARGTLLTFANHLRDGLLPNLFPEGAREGLYHTVDATLWFFHAIDRYVAYTGDTETLRVLLPHLNDVVQHHMQGTRFGIRMDVDALLTQGDAHHPLTWMDAKVDDWIVTPRRGKPVEVNALWFNALNLLAEWRRLVGEDPAELDFTAARIRKAFNERFWYAAGGHLYDIVDGEQGDDPSCRPNQIMSFALRFPVLDEARWEPVLNVVVDRLVTPVGLRSLAPAEQAYKAQYFGDLRARDAAYHQGTVWGWLIGPFIDAWLRVHPDRLADTRQFLAGFEKHLNEACIGNISEVFDGAPPFTPRGCVAQAWSVAEVLRCLKRLETAG